MDMDKEYTTVNASDLRRFKYLTCLAMMYGIALVSSATLVYKPIALWSTYIPGATLVFPFTYFLGDVVAEVYGYSEARKLIWYSMAGEFVFAVFSYLGVIAKSPPFWHLQDAYNIVLGPMPRVFFASFIGTTIGAFVNAYAITKWKILVKGKIFAVRSIASTCIGEATLSLVTVTIIFYNKVPSKELLIMMGSGYVFKLLYAIIASVPATFLVRLLKKNEGVDYYDYSTNFNPFKI